MSILADIKNIPRTRKDLRNFGLTVGGVLVAIGLFLLYRNSSAALPVLGIGAALIVFGLIFQRILLPLHLTWMAFAVVMGFVVSHIILLIIFVFVFSPIGFIKRLTGAPFLETKIDKKRASYWEPREQKKKTGRDLEKQF